VGYPQPPSLARQSARDCKQAIRFDYRMRATKQCHQIQSPRIILNNIIESATTNGYLAISSSNTPQLSLRHRPRKICSSEELLQPFPINLAYENWKAFHTPSQPKKIKSLSNAQSKGPKSKAFQTHWQYLWKLVWHPQPVPSHANRQGTLYMYFTSTIVRRTTKQCHQIQSLTHPTKQNLQIGNY